MTTNSEFKTITIEDSIKAFVSNVQIIPRPNKSLISQFPIEQNIKFNLCGSENQIQNVYYDQSGFKCILEEFDHFKNLIKETIFENCYITEYNCEYQIATDLATCTVSMIGNIKEVFYAEVYIDI